MSRTIVVVPCYNEARRLDIATFRHFSRTAEDVQFLLVDDGSSDGTLDVLRTLQEEAPARFQVHALPQNSGKAEAVRQGICAALLRAPDFVGFWDADLATPLDAIVKFRNILVSRPKALAVLGSRVRMLGRNIDRKFGRHVMGRVFATAASCVLGLPVYDTQCGAKLFRCTPVIAAVFAQPFRSRWIFDVEILARIMQDRGESRVESPVYELPLDDWRDVTGSKLRPMDFVRSLFELWEIHRRYSLRNGPRLRIHREMQETVPLPTSERKAA